MAKLKDIRAADIPPCTDKHDVRSLEIGVMPKGEPTFSERTTRIRIEDEAGGEFVKIVQGDGRIAIDPDEWPVLRDAIEHMIGQCRGDSS